MRDDYGLDNYLLAKAASRTKPYPKSSEAEANRALIEQHSRPESVPFDSMPLIGDEIRPIELAEEEAQFRRYVLGRCAYPDCGCPEMRLCMGKN